MIHSIPCLKPFFACTFIFGGRCTNNRSCDCETLTSINVLYVVIIIDLLCIYFSLVRLWHYTNLRGRNFIDFQQFLAKECLFLSFHYTAGCAIFHKWKQLFYVYVSLCWGLISYVHAFRQQIWYISWSKFTNVYTKPPILVSDVM